MLNPSSLERMEQLKKCNEDYLFGFQEFNQEADDQFLFVMVTPLMLRVHAKVGFIYNL